MIFLRNGFSGADILTGGTGCDNFLFQLGDGIDNITDFVAEGTGQDHIYLHPISALEISMS